MKTDFKTWLNESRISKVAYDAIELDDIDEDQGWDSFKEGLSIIDVTQWLANSYEQGARASKARSDLILKGLVNVLIDCTDNELYLCSGEYHIGHDGLDKLGAALTTAKKELENKGESDE